MNKSAKLFLVGAAAVAALWLLSGMPQEPASPLVSDAQTGVSANSQLPLGKMAARNL